MSTSLNEILTDIAATKAKLKKAEDANDTERIARLENLLIEQQREKNILFKKLNIIKALGKNGILLMF